MGLAALNVGDDGAGHDHRNCHARQLFRATAQAELKLCPALNGTTLCPTFTEEAALRRDGT
jgi:hypothetical protein